MRPSAVLNPQYILETLSMRAKWALRCKTSWEIYSRPSLFCHVWNGHTLSIFHISNIIDAETRSWYQMERQGDRVPWSWFSSQARHRHNPQKEPMLSECIFLVLLTSAKIKAAWSPGFYYWGCHEWGKKEQGNKGRVFVCNKEAEGSKRERKNRILTSCGICMQTLLCFKFTCFWAKGPFLSHTLVVLLSPSQHPDFP